MNKKKWLFIKFIIGVLILSLLIYKIGLKDIFHTAARVNGYYIILLLALGFFNLFIGALNIKVLSKPFVKFFSAARVFRYYALTFALGLLFPGRVGDLSLIYFLNKENISLGHSSAIFVLDKLITLSIYSLFTIFGFFIFFNKPQSVSMSLFLLLFSMAIFFIIFSDKGRGIIKKYLLRKYADKFKGFSKSLFDYTRNYKKKILLNYFLTLVKIAVDTLILYIIFISFGVSLNFLHILIIRSLIIIISLIPLTPNGIGIRESAAVFLFSKLNVAPAVTVAVMILFMVLNYFIAALIIILFFKKKDVAFNF